MGTYLEDRYSHEPALVASWKPGKCLPSTMIEKLESMGLKRWTRGGYDRLYFSPSILGLECNYYRSGNISSATLDGESISNAEAYRIKASKVLVDVPDGTCGFKGEARTGHELVVRACDIVKLAHEECLSNLEGDWKCLVS